MSKIAMMRIIEYYKKVIGFTHFDKSFQELLNQMLTKMEYYFDFTLTGSI
jgi:hypothetical protein